MYRLVVRETATHKVAGGDDTGPIKVEDSVIACAHSGYMKRAFHEAGKDVHLEPLAGEGYWLSTSAP